MSKKTDPERVVREIKRKTRRKFSAEEKIRIILEGLRGELSIAEFCRREGISPNLYYSWSKDFLEAGNRRLMGDTKREATSGEVASRNRSSSTSISASSTRQTLLLRANKSSGITSLNRSS